MTTTADTLAAQADTAFQNAQTQVTDAITQSETALAKAQAISAGLFIQSAGGSKPPIAVTPNLQTRPQTPTDFTTDIQNAFDYAFNTLNDGVRAQIVNYLSTFFPDIAATLKSGSDQWLINTITNGNYMPASVEAAIWNRAKDKEVIEAARAEQDIIDASAARGFAAPPGVVNYTIAATREELAKKTASINRDIAIKSFDLANENSKFAVQQAVQLRSNFVQAMGDFIKTAMILPNSATEYAKAVVEAKSSFYDASIKLYSAEVDEEKMRTGVQLEYDSLQIRSDEVNTEAISKYWDTRVANARMQADVAVAAADQLARIAAAAMATRNSVVSVSASV